MSEKDVYERYIKGFMNLNGKELAKYFNCDESEILLDDFENFIPIKNFNNMIDTSRIYNIKMTVFIRSFLDLINTYGSFSVPLPEIYFV